MANSFPENLKFATIRVNLKSDLTERKTNCCGEYTESFGKIIEVLSHLIFKFEVSYLKTIKRTTYYEH